MKEKAREDLQNLEEIEHGRFVIDTTEKAQWACRKIRQAMEEIEAIKAEYKAQLRRAEADLKGLLHYLQPMLENWVRQRLENEKRKSIFLGGLKVGFRRQPDKIEIVDEETALREAERLVPEAVQTVKKLQKTVLWAHYRSTGEIVPGTEVKEGGDGFFLVPIKEKGGEESEMA